MTWTKDKHVKVQTEMIDLEEKKKKKIKVV